MADACPVEADILLQIAEMRCAWCHRHPDELDEYARGAAWEDDEFVCPAQYVAEEEGTYNEDSNEFCCTECYVKIGCPSVHVSQMKDGKGWTAPSERSTAPRLGVH